MSDTPKGCGAWIYAEMPGGQGSEDAVPEYKYPVSGTARSLRIFIFFIFKKKERGKEGGVISMQLWAEGHHGWQESHTETAVIETKEIASLLKANNPQDRRGAMQCLRMMLDLYISVYMPYIDPYLNQKDMSDARVVGRTRKMEERLNSDKENTEDGWKSHRTCLILDILSFRNAMEKVALL